MDRRRRTTVVSARRIVPVALIALLTACAPVPSPTGTGAAAPPSPSPTPSAATYAPPVVTRAAPAPRQAVAPTRVRVAAAGIDMAVVAVGVEPGGFMELPPDPAIAGWYRFGPDPWSPDGNTVISAHIDAPNHPIGPFARLRDLSPGTDVIATAADGSEAVYAVVSVTYYPKQDLPTDEIFARSGTRMLALITCGGAFDQATGRYADNVVVMAAPRT